MGAATEAERSVNGVMERRLLCLSFGIGRSGLDMTDDYCKPPAECGSWQRLLDSL